MYKRYAFALCCVTLLGASWLLDRVQAQGKGSLPVPGDIVAYEELGKTNLGLVIDTDSIRVFVEIVGLNGQFKTDWFSLSGFQAWRFVDRFQKPRKFASREWRSADGKSQLTATLKAIEGDKVRLIKDNGKSIAVTIADLSNRDQEYIKQASGKAPSSSDNPFDVEESVDHPEEVMQLIARRNELLEIEAIHERMAKQGQDPVIGDIIKYQSSHNGMRYGLIVGSDSFSINIEFVDDDGTIAVDMSPAHSTRWRFFDRPSQSKALDSRTWSSSSGKFSISATMHGVSGDRVELKKEDGESLTVEISKLSSDDQEYVKRNRHRVNRIDEAEIEERRANYPADVQKLLARRGEVLKLRELNRQTAEDVSKTETIVLKTSPFNLEPSQMMPLKLGNRTFSKQLSLENVYEFARIRGVAYAIDSGQVAFVAASPHTGVSLLVVVDINTGNVSTNSDQVARESEVVAISPSGKTIAVFIGKGIGNRLETRLELWRHDNGALQRTSTVSYDSFFTPTMQLFDDHCGAVMNSNGQLIFFDIDQRIIPTHQIQSEDSRSNSNQIFLSNDRQTLYYFSVAKNSFYGIDTASKQCIGGFALPAGSQRGKGFPGPIVQITPDGEHLVVALEQSMTFLSMKTGEEVGEYHVDNVQFSFHSRRSSYSMLQMLSSNVVFLSNTRIYDLELGTDIGSVPLQIATDYLPFADASQVTISTDRFGSMHAGRGGFSTSDNDRVLVQNTGAPRNDTALAGGRPGDLFGHDNLIVTISAQRLPIDDILAQAEQLSDKDVLVMGSGDSVKLTMDLGEAQQMASAIRSKVERDLAEGGVKLSDNGEFLLHLEYKVGQQESRSFQIVGNGRSFNQVFTVTPKSCTATITYRDEVIWSTSNSGGFGNPGDVDSLKRNIRLADNISAKSFLDFRYPSSIHKIRPNKKISYSWQ